MKKFILILIALVLIVWLIGFLTSCASNENQQCVTTVTEKTNDAKENKNGTTIVVEETKVVEKANDTNKNFFESNVPHPEDVFQNYELELIIQPNNEQYAFSLMNKNLDDFNKYVSMINKDVFSVTFYDYTGMYYASTAPNGEPRYVIEVLYNDSDNTLLVIASFMEA